MQASYTPLILSFIGGGGKKGFDVSKTCIIAALLYLPLHLTNKQSVSKTQILFKTEYKQNGVALLGGHKGSSMVNTYRNNMVGGVKSNL